MSSSHPTIILLGNKLSYKAFDSLKNSGLNIMLFALYFSRTDLVYPTGMVDLITIVGLLSLFFVDSRISSITDSTAEQSK